MSVDAIRTSAVAHKRKLDNQEKRQRVELDMNKQAHSANLEDLRKSNQLDAANLRDEHERLVNEKILEKEARLEKIRLTMQETQSLTDKELKRQEELHKKTLADRNESFRQNSAVTREQQELSLEDTNHRYNVAARDAHNKQLEETAQREARFRNQDIQQKNAWNAKINENRTKFAETYQSEDMKFNHLRMKQERDYKKNLKTNHDKNEVKLTEQQKLHLKHENALKEQNNQAIQDREVMFEKKYQGQLGRHLEAEKNLESINQKVVDESKEGLIKRVKVYADRSDDPFFHFTQVKPQITEEPDHYVLKLQIPEYAKEEVILSTNQREIVMTFNRRHKEERTDEDGAKLKFDKVESTVSRMPVAYILNPRKITKAWADGVLTYKIMKA